MSELPTRSTDAGLSVAPLLAPNVGRRQLPEHNQSQTDAALPVVQFAPADVPRRHLAQWN